MTDVAEACTKYPSLRSLSIRCKSSSSGRRGESVLKIVQPLLKFCELEEVNLQYGCTRMDIADHNMREIARAWPHLTCFSLSCLPNPSAPTVGTLVAFSKSCPDLKHLTLPLMTHKHDIHELLTSPPAPHGLRSLKFVWGPWLYQSPQALAQYLLRMFPNIILRYNKPVYGRLLDCPSTKDASHGQSYLVDGMY